MSKNQIFAIIWPCLLVLIGQAQCQIGGIERSGALSGKELEEQQLRRFYYRAGEKVGENLDELQKRINRLQPTNFKLASNKEIDVEPAELRSNIQQLEQRIAPLRDGQSFKLLKSAQNKEASEGASSAAKSETVAAAKETAEVEVGEDALTANIESGAETVAASAVEGAAEGAAEGAIAEAAALLVFL